jgi:hypothetical protein
VSLNNKSKRKEAGVGDRGEKKRQRRRKEEICIRIRDVC